MEFATGGGRHLPGFVNRHACGFANEAFEAPMGGIGLQVRYETGAPYTEQISWVAGNRRYKVQVSAYDVRPTTPESWESRRSPPGRGLRPHLPRRRGTGRPLRAPRRPSARDLDR